MHSSIVLRRMNQWHTYELLKQGKLHNPQSALFARVPGQVLREEARAIRSTSTFDVFLSHSYDDAEVILGVKKIMESLGLRVYVDWIDDAGLDRGQVTRSTAAILRMRMRASLSLVYAHSASSGDSNWMPWELGYFDGFKPGCLWLLPIVTNYDSEFNSQEYLGLYPTVDKNSGHLWSPEPRPTERRQWHSETRYPLERGC